ncbi:MAG: hypothetical protein DRJ42_04680 [Deltaproteobacteria bacterium]|nr:MAG: hypothetical protein DRJ42_04680 [Deltaproteobacteria bacterium]
MTFNFKFLRGLQWGRGQRVKTGSRARRLLRGLRNLGLLVLASWGTAHGASCATPTTEFGVDPVEARRILDSIANLVVLPTLEATATAMGELETATAAFAGSAVEDDRLASQEAWRTAMRSWERVEVLQIGPTGPHTSPGGMDIRDEVYSWPLTNRCRIDQELVAESYTDPAAFAAELVNVRGLDTMEYLLFVDVPSNACSELSPINADGTWAALGEDVVRARRAAYAASVATLVAEEATELRAAWSPAGGAFADDLANAGLSSSTYATTQQALDEVIRAMFYVDLLTKDVKLGQPLGMGACATATCPGLVESREAAASKEHIAQNLRAFQQLYLGGPDADAGAGFDELLVGVGEDVLAERMATNIEAAIAAVEAIDGSLQTAVDADNLGVVDALAAVQLMTSDLKGPMVTALSLRIPAEGAGDAD